MSDSSPRFSSRFAFLVSALGIAVGTGNIWRFPRIAASNGGDDGAGSFLIAWVTFLLGVAFALVGLLFFGGNPRFARITFFLGVSFAFAWMAPFFLKDRKV